jgi:hypothetical protein
MQTQTVRAATENTVDAPASELLEARETAKPIAPITVRHPGLSIVDVLRSANRRALRS